jgi:hypothetical protein
LASQGQAESANGKCSEKMDEGLGTDLGRRGEKRLSQSMRSFAGAVGKLAVKL